LAFVASLAFTWLTISRIRYAFRNRLIPMLVQSVSRDQEPMLYWGVLGFEVACGSASVAIAIFSMLRLMEGAAAGLPLDAG
jgi:hypothetical protein